MNIKKTFALAAAMLVAGIGSSQALSISVVDGGVGSGISFTSSTPLTYTGTFDITSLYSPLTMELTSAEITFSFWDKSGGETVNLSLGGVLFATINGIPNNYPEINPFSYTLEGSFFADLSSDGILTFSVFNSNTNTFTLTEVRLDAEVNALNAPSVPDNGSTILILGFALLAVVFLQAHLRTHA